MRVQSLSLDKLVGPFAVSQSVRRKRSEFNQQKQTNEAESGGRVQAGRQRISRDVSVLVFNRVQAELGNLERFLRLRGLFDRVFQRHSVLFGGQASDLGGAPPRYLRDIAAINGVDISQYHWGLFARGEYSSRKVLFLLFREGEASPEFIVKITRDPALNPRLENENRALVTLAQQGIGDRDTLPRVAFSGEHAGLAIVGETIVDGVPFEQRSNETVDCAYAHAAINWITELGEATADPNTASPLRVAEAMNRLLERFAQIYHLPAAHYEFLSRQTAALTQGYGQFPLVFQHGDPGTWNILVTPTGRIAFLDWEAAELYGMPLWDLFYFVYTYGIWAARTKSAGDRMKGFEQQFLAASPFNILLAEATSRYCARVGLHKEFVEPLYYTCWMHRALKEATRLTQSQLARGHYLNILRASIDQRAALAPLFSLATSR